MSNPSDQCQEFKNALPKGLRDVAKVSMNYQHYWSIVNSHLKTIYGEYADPQRCLEDYHNSTQYKKNRQSIRRCPDIPIIGMDEIGAFIKEEEEYDRLVKQVCAVWEEEDSLDKTFRLASLLGLLPEKNPNTIYRYLIAKERILADGKQTELMIRAKENSNLLMVMSNILAKLLLNCFTAEYKLVGSIITQFPGRYYYRGENAYYRTSKASRFRSQDTDLPRWAQEFIYILRLYQCWDTFDQFDAVRKWGISSINYMALAQHYGFRTQIMDITSNLKIALFFACCKYTDNHWEPLQKGDFEHRNSRKSISQRNGDSRYGVIYQCPAEIADMCWHTEKKVPEFKTIAPVGYQPLMRCSQQYAYMMKVNEEYDLYQDMRFNKFKFRLTEEICEWIFEEMEQGDAVYPRKDIPDISREIYSLNHQTEILKSVFDAAADDFKLNDVQRKSVRVFLEERGFRIVDSVSIIDPVRLEKINKEYPADLATKISGVAPLCSPIISI